MPRLKRDQRPKYQRHKGSGQAVVTLDGKDFYLGKWNTAASHREYDRLVGQWEQNGRRLPFAGDEPTILELCAAFWRHAKVHYVKNGRPTGEQAGIKVCLRYLKATYRDTLCRDFGPLDLKAIREQMIQAGNSRGYINQNVSRIKHIFKWGVSEDLVPPDVYQRVQAVEALLKDKCKAREPDEIEPVDDETIAATIENMPQVVADMVLLQRYTGMRPEEVCIVRPVDVDRSGDVWAYRPESHKTQHHKRWRVVLIGPKGQAVLAPYLLREETDYCFRPRRWRETQLHRYHCRSYRDAIHRACDRTFPAPGELAKRADETIAQRNARLTEKQLKALKAWLSGHRWNPNQLRHSAATAINAHADMDTARAVLGHSRTSTTEIYAKADLKKAGEVMARIG